MNIDHKLFNQLLPHQESLASKRQRQNVWDRWDTNSNGILSLKEIQYGILQMFDIQPSEKITFVITQCAGEIKRKYSIGAQYGPNYLEKREFRGFLQQLDDQIKNLIIMDLEMKDQEMQCSQSLSCNSSPFRSCGSVKLRSKRSQQSKTRSNILQRWLKGLHSYVSTQDGA